MSSQSMDRGIFGRSIGSEPRRIGRSGSLRRGPRRWGTAAVEFAMIAPLFFGVLFGIVEFGRAFMVQQVLTNASREGARAAILESATYTDVVADMQTYLASASVPSNMAAITITVNGTAVTQASSFQLDNAGAGDSVQVDVSIEYEDISWIPSWFIPNTTTDEDGSPQQTRLSATTIMLAERLQ